MPLPALPPADVSRVGRYQILSRLAVGGMAEIFLAATQRDDGRLTLVTLKRILPELRDQEEFVQMFEDEARISASLDHPNIGRVFELVKEGPDAFIAMDFIPGQSLTSILRACRKAGRPVPLGFAGMVARDLLNALHHAHTFRTDTGESAPIIHRDVSPNNVMVTYDGVVKVIDFGVAKALGSLSRTGGGMVKGSHGYMSPEQARGAPLDARSDIFSAGVVLHELLTGKPLFLRDSELLTFRGILRDPITAPIVMNPGVPPALSEAVMHALSRTPAARFADAKEMARAVTMSIPALLFDSPKAAEFLGELFKEHLQRTDHLTRRAAEGADLRTLTQAAEAISQGPVPPGLTSHGATRGRGGRTEVYGPLPTAVMKMKDVPLTRARRPTAPPASSAAAAPVEEVNVEGSTVMSVDDSRISRDFIEAHLESFGFPVLSCGSADEALELLEERLPDLILLDVKMPDVDGYELCRRIRERCTRRPFLPILFLSSSLSFEERCKGLSAGGDDFIGKPYEPEELIALVRAHMRRAAFLERLARDRAQRAREWALAQGFKLPGA